MSLSVAPRRFSGSWGSRAEIWCLAQLRNAHPHGHLFLTSIHRHLEIIGLSERHRVWQERIYPFHFCIREILPGVEKKMWAAKSQLAWFWCGCDFMGHKTPFNLRALVCLVLGNILAWTWGHNQNIYVVYMLLHYSLTIWGNESFGNHRNAPANKGEMTYNFGASSWETNNFFIVRHFFKEFRWIDSFFTTVLQLFQGDTYILSKHMCFNKKS